MIGFDRFTRVTITRIGVPAFVAMLGSSGAAPVAAQSFEQVGTRALGMGGAFVAVADDASAIYWNPAGLAHGGLVSLVAEWRESETWSDHRVHRAPALAGSGILVAMGTPSLGLAYYRLRTAAVVPQGTEDGSDPAREDPGGAVSLDGLVTQHAAVAFVQPFVGGLTLGTVLKYVRGTTAREAGDAAVGSAGRLDRAQRLDGDADSAFDLDLALMAVAGRLRIGIVGHNLRTPTLTSPGGPAVELERQVRAGLAWAGDSGFTAAADLDLTKMDTVFGERRMLALGAQQRVGEWLGIRGGGRFNLEDEDAAITGAVGVSVALGSVFWVDAQMTRGGPLGSERGWGVSGRLGF